MGATHMTQMLVNNPMFSAAAQQYGEDLASRGQAYVGQNVNRFLAVSHIKTYFAVDTNYVLKKLAILLFPFTHRNWSSQYQQTEPLPPRQEINSPDLYIPGTYMYMITLIMYRMHGQFLVINIAIDVSVKFANTIQQFFPNKSNA